MGMPIDITPEKASEILQSYSIERVVHHPACVEFVMQAGFSVTLWDGSHDHDRTWTELWP
jgi:hypothetical protein